jgi:hypothetical protein
MMEDSKPQRRRRLACAALFCAALANAAAPSLWGQTSDASRQELQAQVDAMQSRLQAAQRQIDEDHAELLRLRRQIEALAKQASFPAAGAAPPNAAAADLQQAVADLQERQAIQQAEIQVHEQEKVESASKYSVKLHGLVLVNASVNNGATDQPASPLIAIPAGSPATAANGSLTATGRQTLLGLSATGPTFWGARAYANLDMDFAGENSSGGYATGASLFRLRTAAMEVAWPKTTVRAGISPLILTPYYATSYFSVAEPAMSWSGSLWGWLPQLGVEHRLDISDTQHLTLQAALADIPDAGTAAATGLGAVSAAERSRFPGSELRAAWEGKDRLPASFGIGGYWSPHSYAASSSAPAGSFDAWAATADWRISFLAQLQFSGELYDGAALGGLGAGAFKDVIPANSLSAGAKPAALKDAGGWAQLKAKPWERWEFNFAFGQDNADSGQLRRAGLVAANPFVGLARNQTSFGNVVFRPRANFLLSGEYRKIRSWQITGPADNAGLFGLAAGYEF